MQQFSNIKGIVDMSSAIGRLASGFNSIKKIYPSISYVHYYIDCIEARTKNISITVSETASINCPLFLTVFS